jgi:large subunit ribosomal protein L21
MYAIVEVGGRQYRVSPGEKFLVEKLAHVAGSSIELPVLLLSDETGVTVGKPYVDGKALSVKVIGNEKGEKLVAFKYQPKKRYRKKTGHRQTYTILQVADGSEPASTVDAQTADTQPVETQPVEAQLVATEPATETAGETTGAA